jgi:hypothetical protein
MPTTDGYSAKVALRLLINDVKLALSHVGGSGLVVKDECQPIPAGPAKLIINVDDSVETREIFLPHGIPGPRQPVPFF